MEPFGFKSTLAKRLLVCKLQVYTKMIQAFTDLNLKKEKKE